MSEVSAPEPRSVGRLRIVSIFAGFGLVALFIYLMVVGEAILLPFVIAIFIVTLLDSLALRISITKIKGRSLPDWASMAISILLFIGVFLILANMIRSNITAVNEALPAYEKNIAELINRIIGYAGATEIPSIQEITKQIDIQMILERSVSALASITGNTLTILFYIVFILLEQVTFKRKIDALFLKNEDRRRAREMIGRITKDIQTYIGIKTFLAVVTGLMSYVVMAVVGVDFAGFWAVLILVLSYIPYIGALVGVAFPAILTLVQFDSLIPFFITTSLLTVVQIIFGNFLEPRMIGRSLNLSPLVILLSLAVFGSIWGVAGMILSMPFMVIAMIVCAGFEATRPVAVILSATGSIDPRPDQS